MQRLHSQMKLFKHSLFPVNGVGVRTLRPLSSLEVVVCEDIGVEIGGGGGGSGYWGNDRSSLWSSSWTGVRVG